jgi:hypothetical protein
MRFSLSLGGLALVLATGPTLQAQSPFQLGIAGGVAISNLDGDDVEGAASRTMGYFGGVLVWQPAAMLGFETGVYYVPKGAESDFEGEDGTIKLNYVEVPVLLRLAFPLAQSSIRPVLTVGGTVAFKASCDLEADAGGASVNIDCDEFFELLGDEFGVDTEVQSVDFGLTAGLAADIPVGERVILSPAVKYTRGLRDVLEIDGFSVDAKNSSFQVGLALRFRI